VRQLDDALIQRLYARAAADRWKLPLDAFRSFLSACVQREFDDSEPDGGRLERHLASLHLEDLALACACAEGIDDAWDAFVLQFRPLLYRAADALDPSGGAREVADSLYGELFGLKSRDGERQSHLRYFHGRSSLATWLRAVLSQRYVDRKRLQARVEQLPDESAARLAAAPRDWPASRRYFELMARVMAAVVAALPARDRLRVRCYYQQEMTLAEIGKMLGESEATSSRQLARTRRTIREQTECRLRDEERLSAPEIDELFAAIVADAGPLDLAELIGQDASEAGQRSDPILADGRKERRQDRSKFEGRQS
jgi:RNA polymerase sigma factor (sigma-70 family)